MSLQNQWKVPCVLFKCSHLCFFFGEVAISHPQSSRAAPHFVSHSFCRRAPSPLSLCSCSVSLCTVQCALCTLQSWGTNHCSHICVCYKEHLVPILVSFIAMHCGSPVLHFTVLFHSAVKCPPLKSNSHGWRLLRLCLGPASLPLCLSASLPLCPDLLPIVVPVAASQVCPPLPSPSPPSAPPSIPTTGACYTLKVPSLFFPHHWHHSH